jgi:diadenosine tetraphosphate (Ap4A) HIT family hydrolase
MSALDHLWAGWRSDFIASGASSGASSAAGPGDNAGKDGSGASACVFCRILSSGLPDDELHVIWRHAGGRAVAILNAYPYISGHLMVMPTRHVPEVEEMSPEEAVDVWELTRAAVRAVKGAYRPDGLNLGANLGKAAGAGVPGHFHMHVLPRWSGDTNFMTTVADARVLPEPLSESAAKLRASWLRLTGPPKIVR